MEKLINLMSQYIAFVKVYEGKTSSNDEWQLFELILLVMKIVRSMNDNNCSSI